MSPPRLKSFCKSSNVPASFPAIRGSSVLGSEYAETLLSVVKTTESVEFPSLSAATACSEKRQHTIKHINNISFLDIIHPLPYS